MSAKLDRAILLGFPLIIAFAALSHGAVEAWALAVFELLVIALAAIYAVRLAHDGSFRLRLPAPAWPLFGLLALCLAQSISYTNASGERVSLSLDVEATRSTALALTALIAAFLIAANVLNTRERLNLFAQFLTIYGLAMALYALIHHSLGDAPGWMVTGPFVNHNHFSGHLELLLPIPTALAVLRVFPGQQAVYAFAAVVMGVIATASLSRAGMMSIAAEMLFIMSVGGWLAYRRQTSEDESDGILSLLLDRLGLSRWNFLRTRASSPLMLLGALTIVCATVAGIFWYNPEPLIERVTNNRVIGTNPRGETFFNSRGWVWRDTAAMIQARPIAGIGLGAYATAYALYCVEDSKFAPEQGHSDALQIFADGGLIGGLLAVSFVVLAVREIARSLRSSDALLSAIALGSAAGVVGLFVHSIFDFNLQLPSNSLLFLLLLAVISQVGWETHSAASAAMKPALVFGRIATQ